MAPDEVFKSLSSLGVLLVALLCLPMNLVIRIEFFLEINDRLVPFI